MSGLWTDNRLERFLKRVYSFKPHGPTLTEVSPVVGVSIDLEPGFDLPEMQLPAGRMFGARFATVSAAAANGLVYCANPAGSNKVLCLIDVALQATFTGNALALHLGPYIFSTTNTGATLDRRPAAISNSVGQAQCVGVVNTSATGATANDIAFWREDFLTATSDPRHVDLRGVVLPPGQMCFVSTVAGAFTGNINASFKWYERESASSELQLR